MIEIGIIAKGGGLMRRPIVRDIRLLRRTLADVGSVPAIELAYVIPGPLGRADFDGFDLGGSRTGNRHPIVFVDVPSSTARAEDPMADIVELGRRAIEFARVTLPPAKAAALDFDELLKVLNDAATVHVGPDQVSTLPAAPAPAKNRSQRPSDRHPPADQEALILISLQTSDRDAVADAFKFETALQERIERSGFGYVDGNEVGQGEFTIFVYGPASAPIRNLVESFVRREWQRPGASLRLIDEGNHEGEVVSL